MCPVGNWKTTKRKIIVLVLFLVEFVSYTSLRDYDHQVQLIFFLWCHLRWFYPNNCFFSCDLGLFAVLQALICLFRKCVLQQLLGLFLPTFSHLHVPAYQYGFYSKRMIVCSYGSKIVFIVEMKVDLAPPTLLVLCALSHLLSSCIPWSWYSFIFLSHCRFWNVSLSSLLKCMNFLAISWWNSWLLGDKLVAIS